MGLNSLFTSVLQVLNLAELGVGSAMTFSMYKPIAEDDKETICALMRLYKIYYRIIGTVILAAGLMITPFIPSLIKQDVPSDINIYILYLMNLGSTVLSYWLFAYKNCLLYAHQRNDIVDRTSATVICLQQLIQVVTLFLFKNYYFYLVVVLAAQIVKNITNAIIATRMFPDYRPQGKLAKVEVKKINQRVEDLFTAKIGSTVVNSADSIVISAFMGLTALAMYNNYYYVMSSVSAFVSIVFTAITAGVGNSLVTASIEKNFSDFKKLTFIVSWICGFCLSCFYCLYQPFMEIWVGQELMYGQAVVALFCFYFYLGAISGIFTTYKDAAGIWHEDRFRSLVGAAANLILNLAFVRQFGVYAILMSTILSYLVINIPWLIYNLFHVLFKRSAYRYIVQLLGYTGISIVGCAITAFCCNYIVLNGFIGLFVKAIVCIIVPNIFFLVVYFKTDMFRECIGLVKRIKGIRKTNY